MPYDRDRAVRYAEQWWSGYNPAFRSFQDDCTNFISQCLFAGGMDMEVTGGRDSGWWYLHPEEGWSFSWAVAHSLRWYLETSGRCEPRGAARDLELGDVICYDFEGDDVFDHSAMVVGFDRAGEPLVAAHTVASWGRPWGYRESPAFTQGARYRFWHVAL